MVFRSVADEIPKEEDQKRRKGKIVSLFNITFFFNSNKESSQIEGNVATAIEIFCPEGRRRGCQFSCHVSRLQRCHRACSTIASKKAVQRGHRGLLTIHFVVVQTAFEGPKYKLNVYQQKRSDLTTLFPPGASLLFIKKSRIETTFIPWHSLNWWLPFGFKKLREPWKNEHWK